MPIQKNMNSPPLPVVSQALPNYLSEAQLNFISQKTPKQYVKVRPGPGGIPLSAAASDCLKKCASMLGIAGDVYWKELELQAPEETTKETPVAYFHKISTSF